MTVSVVGVSYHTAPLELRELVAVREEAVAARLEAMRAAFPDAELALVSTCNRTEVYVAGIDAAAGRQCLTRLLAHRADPATLADLDRHVYVRSGGEAAEHLLAVACGLDAMVVGETEILGQVKRAYGIAEACQTVGRVLQPLFQTAFKVAKQVHSETELGRGRVSVSSLAVEFAEKVFDDLSAKTVMIVGAGETAELALKSLMDRGVRNVIVLNRSFHRGQALAEQCGGRAIQYDLLGDYLPRADIVISSTSAPHAVIRAPAIRNAIGERRGRPMLMIDLAVPRDIDPEAAEIKDVYVYTIDDLRRIAEANLAKRREAVDQAWRIVRQGCAELAARFESGGPQALLRQLDERGVQVCERALQRALGRGRLAALPEDGRAEVRELAQKIVGALLAEPRKALRRAAGEAGWEHYARVAGDLFGFGPQADAPAAPDEGDETKREEGV